MFASANTTTNLHTVLGQGDRTGGLHTGIAQRSDTAGCSMQMQLRLVHLALCIMLGNSTGTDPSVLLHTVCLRRMQSPNM